MIAPMLRIGQAAKLVGLSGKTLKRAEREGILKFTRRGRSFRYISHSDLMHAPVLSQRRAARKLDLRSRKLGKLLAEWEAENPVPTEFAHLHVFRYFSLAAVRMLGRREPAFHRLRIGFKVSNTHWWNGSLLTFPERDYIKLIYDAMDDNE